MYEVYTEKKTAKKKIKNIYQRMISHATITDLKTELSCTMVYKLIPSIKYPNANLFLQKKNHIHEGSFDGRISLRQVIYNELVSI